MKPEHENTNDAEDKPASFEERLSTAESISELKVRVASTQESLASIRDQLGILKRLEDLQADVRRWEWFAKYVSITTGILLALLSILGYRSFRGVVQTIVNEQVAKQISPIAKRLSYYEDLTAGSANALQNPTFAIGRWLNCFCQDRYDETVVVPLLDLLSNMGDFKTAEDVVNKLKENRYRYRRLNRAITFNNVAAIELSLGRDNMALIERSKEDLDLAYAVIRPDDQSSLFLILRNYYRYYFLKGDPKQAETYIRRLRELGPLGVQQAKELEEEMAARVRH
jgi:hypothetical protein